MGTTPAPAPPPEPSKGGPTRRLREAAAKRRRLAPRAPAGCSLSCRNLVPTAGTGCEGVLGGAWRAALGIGGLSGGKPAPAAGRAGSPPHREPQDRESLGSSDRPWAKEAASPGKVRRSPAGRAGGAAVHSLGNASHAGVSAPKQPGTPISRETTAGEQQCPVGRHPQRGHSCSLPHF